MKSNDDKINRTNYILMTKRIMKAIHQSLLLLEATMLLISSTADAAGAASVGEFTLCEGTYSIPLAFATINDDNQTTCLEASTESIFCNESSQECSSFRSRAKISCGCPPANEDGVLTNACRICGEENEEDFLLTSGHLSTIAIENGDTCMDVAMEALFHDAMSDLCLHYYQPLGLSKCGCATAKNATTAIPNTTNTNTDTPTASPSSITDREPNCQSLISGMYPFAPSETNNSL
jgi:hypothetical protein